jgi:transposase
LKQIAIAEISIGKHHKYLTIVLDLISGSEVYVADGKGKESLESFFKQIRVQRAEIETLALDMSPAYTGAIRESLPEATLVFDHFHVIKYFNDQLIKLTAMSTLK